VRPHKVLLCCALSGSLDRTENRLIYGPHSGRRTARRLRRAFRKHYADLFALYEDANRKDQEAVLAFVRSKTTYGADAQKKAVATFKTLCAFGDFATDTLDDDDGDDEPEVKVPKPPKDKPSKTKEGAGGGGSVALTVNIQLQLPENASGDVYEKLFAAMEKHLKGLIGTE
jgi:hypothetical protein